MKQLWNSLKQVMSNKIFVTFIGLIALTVIIWYGGPLLAIADYQPWKTETARLMTLLLIAVVWGFSNFRHKVKSEKSNADIIDQMLDSGDTPVDSASAEEITFLQGRMQEALQILKGSKLPQGKNLYSLPWYIIIGPPGSGKTTALNNSGLNFPLKERMGSDAIHGIGGTRNCDWWFTDRAILLDTAGRYTTQDSNAKADSIAWIGFLELLKKNRPRRPINGVLVTISLTDLVTQTTTERNIYARAIKQRLQELHNRLAINFPIYVMFTKADLLSGFNEFFDDLSREEREQVWGVTFPSKQNEQNGGAVADFNRRYLELIKRVNERVFSLQNQERNPERRSTIYEFPKQLRAMQDRMDVFLKEIFSPNQFEQNPLLRGVYIASATQQGTPLDRVIGQFAEALGLSAKQPLSHTGKGKGFFLKRLFDDVIFPEQNLATANFRMEKRSFMFRRGSIALSLLALVTCLVGWTYSYQKNLGFAQSVDQHIDGYEALTNGGLSQATDLVTLNAGLLSLRDLPQGFEHNQQEIPQGIQWGLYQGDKFGEQAVRTYRTAIQTVFIPYLVRILEKQIANNMGSSEFLYTSLKFYLMLQMKDKMDKEMFSLWLGNEWTRILPGKVNDEIRGNLMEHLRVALDDVQMPKLDERVIQQAREELQQTSLANRAYLRLKEDVVDISPPGFRITDVVNSRKARLFTRRSGTSLGDEVPGLFTYDGYYGVFQVEGNSLLKSLAEESWIYGKEFEEQLQKENLDVLYAEVEQLYFDEYISHWRALIDDIELDGFTSAQEGESVLRQLTTGRKPIQSILDALVKNLQLTKGGESEVQTGLQKLASISDNAPAGLENTRLAREKNRLTRLMPKNINEFGQPMKSGNEVESEFNDILYFTLGDSENGDKPQSEEILPALEGLEKYLKQLTDQNGGSVAYQSKLLKTDSGAMAIKKLNDYGRDFPRPFNQWFGRLASDANNLTTSGAKQHLSALWENTVLKEYESAISGRYPLEKTSSTNIKLNDFKRFFGYEGTLDKFFLQHLAPFVDKTKSPWVFNSYVGVKQSTLRQFQRADKIRQMFFKQGSQELVVEFALVPKYLDTQVSQFILEIEDQVLTYRHGPTRAIPFVWPGSKNSGVSRFVFTPHNGGNSSSVTEEGPWSWFRMLDTVKENKSSSKDRIDLKFVSKGNEAIVELVTDSVVNPFDLLSLERFQCPRQL